MQQAGVMVVVCLALSVSTSWQKELLQSDKDICRLFKNDEKLRKPGTCNMAIRCENFKSLHYVDCGQSYYSLRTGACVTTISDSYCAPPCKRTSPTFVADPKNCVGWFQCNGDQYVRHGTCPHSQYFDQTAQMCLYPDDMSCAATYEFCDVVPLRTPIKDEFNCAMYFECQSSLGSVKLISKQCDNGLYFDVTTGTCLPKAQVLCESHPLPQNVCGTSKLALRNRFVSDEATCRGYYYCRDLGVGVPDPSPTWAQCADVKNFFDSTLEICTDRTYVKCNEDRCDGRPSGRELSERRGCQHYLNCHNNYTVSEEYCGDGLYFNAQTEQCTTQRFYYNACS